MKERDPLYVISVASRLVGMHAQTLRKYERERFVVPSRTKGRLRLYAPADLARLRQIKQLVEVQGLNLAGVELVLHVSQRLQALRESARAAQSTGELQERVEHDARELIALLGYVSDDDAIARADLAGNNATNGRGRSRRTARGPVRRRHLPDATKE